MTDSADWLPYSIVRSQPAASIVVQQSMLLPQSGITYSAVIPGVALKQIRLLRLDLRSSTPAPVRVDVFGATGARISARLDPYGYVKLIDEVPVDWPVGENVDMSGTGTWADVVLDISGLYLLI